MNTPNNNNKIRPASVRLSAVATSTRQTPKTDFGTLVRDGLVRAGGVVAEVARPFIPGGSIISAALAGANNVASRVAGASYSGASSAGSSYGTSSSALTAGGGGLAGGGAAGGGSSLGLPGPGPGLGNNLGASPSSFAPGGGGAGLQPTDAFKGMMAATTKMTEFQASFNLQYLNIQQKIQTDTRQFNLISNIMKTKHDAAKNALNNVR